MSEGCVELFLAAAAVVGVPLDCRTLKQQVIVDGIELFLIIHTERLLRLAHFHSWSPSPLFSPLLASSLGYKGMHGYASLIHSQTGVGL